jgi:hypothetical protein
MACLPVWQEERQKIFFSEEKKQKTFAPCACCGIQAMAGKRLSALRGSVRSTMTFSAQTSARARQL